MQEPNLSLNAEKCLKIRCFLRIMRFTAAPASLKKERRTILNQESCESSDMSSRFRRVHLLLGRDQMISGSIAESACFDCIAWNQNVNADECFALRDLIVLTGSYHTNGHERKSVSVALQIRSIYVEGQKVKGLDSNFLHKRYQRNTNSRGKATKEKKPVKSRHFVYVGERNTKIKREEQL